MANASTSESAAGEFVSPRQVLLAAAICLVAGLGIGYFARGIDRSLTPAGHVSPALAVTPANPHTPTLDDMKHIADSQAAPLLARLKSNPGDSTLLVQVAAIYHAGHQFKEAAVYYRQAVDADPKNVALRTRLASSLYRSGDVDGAIAQLQEGLRSDPRDANSLFNLGMIRLQGKGDGRGAVEAWQKLLKSNPKLDPERRAEVQKRVADVLTSLNQQKAAEGGMGK